jgi:diguanylate cyclase (GGDEF)-like protein
MGKHADVTLRENKNSVTVPITNSSLPIIEKETREKWQRIINIMAKIIDVPSGLIMQVTENSLSVFLKSQNIENPYTEGASDVLGHGLYCETVIGKDKELLVENAQNDEVWKDNPDTKLDMISYYGLPIHWPDDEIFGTICVLDNKENHYSDKYKALLDEFRESIEADLKNLVYKEKLKYYAEMDVLTDVYNRNKIEEILENQFQNFKTKNEKFSLTIMDINKLKVINDKLGHVKGDEIIKAFANSISSYKKDWESFGRWGGDEFILISPNTGCDEMKTIMENVSLKIFQDMERVIPNASFCYGVAEVCKDDLDYQRLLVRADEGLYECKRTCVVSLI